MKNDFRFIIIDDDPTSTLVTERYIYKTIGDVVVDCFLNPELAVKYLKTFSPPIHHTTVVLLDVLMPGMTGWDVLKEIDHFPAEVKSRFTIMMFSSSLDPADKLRAKVHPLVLDYITKPMDKEKLLKALELINDMMLHS